MGKLKNDNRLYIIYMETMLYYLRRCDILFEKILKYVENENENPHLGKTDVILQEVEKLSGKTKEVHFTYSRGSVIHKEIINKKL